MRCLNSGVVKYTNVAFWTDESVLFIEVSLTQEYCIYCITLCIDTDLCLILTADATVPEVHYSTVEVFPNKGMRVTGHVGSVLIAQLTPTTAKTQNDDRGW